MPDSTTLLIELLVRTLRDTSTDTPTDAAYLFAQTEDNQQSVLEMGVALLKTNQTKQICIADSEPRSGYPGFVYWQQALFDLGVPQAVLQGIPTHEYRMLHTLVEATALVQYAQAHQLTAVEHGLR